MNNGSKVLHGCFCQGDPTLERRSIGRVERFWVGSPGCGALTCEHPRADEAAASWNRVAAALAQS